MKITRRQLRQLIIEAARKIIVDPEGVATPSDVALASGRAKDKRMAAMHPKISDLMSQGHNEPGIGPEGAPGRRQGRSFADALGSEDQLTSAEETAVDTMGYRAEIQDDRPPETLFNIEELLPLFRSKRGHKTLERFGVLTDIHTFLDVSEDPSLGYACQILGCAIQDLGVLPMEHDDINILFYQLMDYLEANTTSTKHVINHNTFYVYEVHGIKFAYYGGFGGFGTIFFCGK